MEKVAQHGAQIFQPEWSATMPPVNRRWVTRRKPAASIMRAKAAGLREAADRLDEIAVGLGIAGDDARRGAG